MPDFQIPVLPLSERVVFGSLLQFLAEEIGARDPAFPVAVLEVCEDTRRLASEPLEQSEAPERAVLYTADATFRENILKALRAVAEREPKLSEQRTKKLSVNGKTPMKSVFRQMEAIPLTVFSMTIDNMGGSTVFFLRTAFTVSETAKELARAAQP